MLQLYYKNVMYNYTSFQIIIKSLFNFTVWEFISKTIRNGLQSH